MAGENCISDNLIALYMPNQGTKGWNHSSQLTFPSLPSPSLFFLSASFSLFFLLPCHLLFSHLPSVHCLSSPRLTSPAPPLPLLDSTLRVEDLLADPDPTHKRRVDNQLPLSSGLNRSSSEFPRDAMPSESGLLPIIPHLLSHSSLIFGSLIPTPFGFCASTSTSNQQSQDGQRSVWDYCFADDQTHI